VQTCIQPSWCHCHSLSLASVKSRLVLPFCYRLTRVVQDKRPLNMCVCVRVMLSTNYTESCCWESQASTWELIIIACLESQDSMWKNDNHSLCKAKTTNTIHIHVPIQTYLLPTNRFANSAILSLNVRGETALSGNPGREFHNSFMRCANSVYTWKIILYSNNVGWLGSRVVSMLDSGTEGPEFKLQLWRCQVTIMGKLFTPIGSGPKVQVKIDASNRGPDSPVGNG